MKKILAFILIMVCFSFLASAIEPSGGNITIINTTRASSEAPMSAKAQAGNVTELAISGFSVTQSWQGYFGNVTGVIQLGDARNNILYNWTLASPQGEIYASTNGSLFWSGIQCFNYTALGTYASDAGQAGGTSLYGKNLSQLESEFGINASDVDGVNETFTLYGDANGHNGFFTANRQFDAGECRSTRIFADSGAGEADNFEEVLLYEPLGQVPVFTALLNRDERGFDQAYHDFEMLVLENGHAGNTATTDYYFYVELE